MEQIIFLTLAFLILSAALIYAVIIGENIDMEGIKPWIQRAIPKGKPFELNTQKGLYVRTVYPNSNSKSIHMIETLNNYEKKRNIKKVELIGFENFILTDKNLKIEGYYKKGYLRKEKFLTIDNFEKIEVIGMDLIDNDSASVECIGYLSGEKHLLQLSYVFPAGKSTNSKKN